MQAKVFHTSLPGLRRFLLEWRRWKAVYLHPSRAHFCRAPHTEDSNPRPAKICLTYSHTHTLVYLAGQDHPAVSLILELKHCALLIRLKWTGSLHGTMPAHAQSVSFP